MSKLSEWIFGKKAPLSEPAVDPDPGMTDELPVVPYRVLYSNLPFYTDPECRHQVADAKILILQAQDPNDPSKEPDVVPTSKHYEPGQLVSWFLNNKKIWEECWFRHPETGEIQRAWSACVEFRGKRISPQARRMTRLEREAQPG